VKILRKNLILEIDGKYYFSEIGGLFKFKIYGIHRAESITEQCLEIVDFKVVENKTYSLKEHLFFWFTLLKDRFR